MSYHKRYEDSYLDEDDEEVAGIALLAETHVALGDTKAAVALWVRLSEIAEKSGDKEFYFRCMEEISNIG